MTIAVVVLGWRADADGTPSDILRWRVEAGVAEWRRHNDAVVIVTGGAVANAVAEGPVMAQLALELGVPASQILVDDTAADTWENVARAHELASAASSVVLISDRLHARRGRRYWLAQFPGDRSRVSVGEVSGAARWYWPVFSAAYETVVWTADLVRRR